MSGKAAAEKSRAAPEAKGSGAPAAAGKGKGTSSGSSRGAPKLDVPDNVGVQAVWLLDAFDGVGLAPVTLDTPLWNLHIAGVPAVEYGLEWLSGQEQVTEIIIFTRSDADGLRTYLATSPRWCKHISSTDTGSAASLRIRVLTSPRVLTAGDAMRFVDDAGVIRADSLIICDGIVISNANLRPALEAHAARTGHDSNCIVTVVCSAFSAAVSPRVHSLPCAYVPLYEQNRFSIDAATGRIVAYDLIPAHSASMFDGVSKKALHECPAAGQYLNLYDTRVYVASPAMLVHFNDNYDYASIRGQYLHNEVQNVELGFKFHAHVLASEYAAPVADLRGLARVTRDLLDGWAGQLHPAAGVLVDGPWTRTPRGAYVHGSASVHPSAVLDAGSIVCAHAVVGEGASVRGSVIGAHVALGAGARVVHSVVDAHAIVEANSVLHRAHVGLRTRIGAGVTLPDGNVIGAGAIVTQSLPAMSHVTCAPRPSSDFDDDDEDAAPAASAVAVQTIRDSASSDVGVVGAAGIGRSWPCDTEADAVLHVHGDDDDDDEHGSMTAASIAAAVASAATGVSGLRAATAAAITAIANANNDDLRAAYESLKAVPALISTPIVSASCTGDEIATAAAAYRVLASNAAVTASAAAPITSAGAAAARDPLQRFHDGLRDFLPPANAEVSPADMRNTTLQIKSFRYAENRSVSEALEVILPYVLDRVPRASSSGGSITLMAMLASMRAVLTQWAPLLGSTETAIEDQLAGIDIVAKYCLAPANSADFKPIFGLIVQTMWELDLALDGAVSEWAAAAEESSDAGVRELRSSKWMERLMEQLDDELEDEDDEEDDDEDADDNEAEDA